MAAFDTSHASGTVTVNSGSEFTIGTSGDTLAGVHTLIIDLTNIAAGESFVVKYYCKVNSADSEVLEDQRVFSDAQSVPGRYVFGPKVSLYSFTYTITRLAGSTSRDFKFRIIKSS
jgi:hypothetical protein